LIADRNPGDLQIVLCCQRLQPRRQFGLGSFPKDGPIRRTHGGCRQAPLLAFDPAVMPLDEVHGLALRSAARNRDTHRTLAIDPQHIPPRVTSSDEGD
jgi:hypothetical protein